jgi:hypothetical protein
MMVFFLAKHTKLTFKVFGQKITSLPTEIGVVLLLIALFYSIWQYVILNRKDVLVFLNIKN